MRGYSNETGEPLKTPKVSQRKKKDASEKRYTKSFTFSAETISYLEEKEKELGRGGQSRYVEELILSDKKGKINP